MTIQELFDKMRLLPDWSAEVKIKEEKHAYTVKNIGVGDFSGALYLRVGEERYTDEEGVDEF